MEYILIRHFGALYINGDPATEYPILNGEWFAPSEHLRLGNTHTAMDCPGSILDTPISL